LQRITRGSVIGKVIRESGVGIDVHVISHPAGEAEDAFVVPRTRRPEALPRRRQLLAGVLAAVGLPALTWVLAQFRDEIELPSVLLLFLLFVVVVSAVGGLLPALATAVVASILVNWYFVEPIHTLTIDEPENILAVIVFVAVAAIVSGVVAVAARRAADARRTRVEAEALSRLAGSSPVWSVLDGLRLVLGLDGTSVLHRQGSGWTVEAASGDRVPESPEAGSDTFVLDDDHVLVLAGRPVRSEDQRVLDAFVKEITAAVNLGELEAEAQSASVLQAANDLRAALLSAVSHDLRAPISAIKASVTSLLEDDIERTPEARRELLEAMRKETDGLNSVVENLLDIGRLQTGALEIRAAPVGLEEIIPAAVRSIGAGDNSVNIDVADSLPRVLADPGLLERALANLIRDAVRYSPPNAPARIAAGTVDGEVDVRVVDRGSGVAEEDHPRLFMPFQRVGDSQNERASLGLAVARGFVEAMGGEVELEETPGGGLTVVVRLRGVG
jgi:two-component system sensor histidine kinase KdpD